MSERLQPGDIWQHTSMGMLCVTSEDMDLHPGYLKCYWRIGQSGLATFMDPAKTEHLTLMQRLGEQGQDGEWRLKAP